MGDLRVNKLQALSTADPSEGDASISTNGGLFIGRNMECFGAVHAGEIECHGSMKVFGVFECPDFFTIDDNGKINFTREIVGSDNDIIKKQLTYLSNMGSKHCPYTDLNSNIISSNTGYFNNLCVGQSLKIFDKNIRIGVPLQINNKKDKLLEFDINEGTIHVPFYKKWDNFIVQKVSYSINSIVEITASVIILDVDDNNSIIINFDGENIPVNTKIKIYFINNLKRKTKINYQIKVFKNSLEYLFLSDLPEDRLEILVLSDMVI